MKQLPNVPVFDVLGISQTFFIALPAAFVSSEGFKMFLSYGCTPHPVIGPLMLTSRAPNSDREFITTSYSVTGAGMGVMFGIRNYKGAKTCPGRSHYLLKMGVKSVLPERNRGAPYRVNSAPMTFYPMAPTFIRVFGSHTTSNDMSLRF